MLKNLYSRSDEGRCSGKLSINLTNKSVLIFEGHYTIRPEFEDILDNNFILLAKRDNLIKRKIDRVADYRDKKELEINGISKKYESLKLEIENNKKNYEKIIDQTVDEISNFIDKTNFEKLS